MFPHPLGGGINILWSKMCSFASRQGGYYTLSERSGIRSSNRPIMSLKEKKKSPLSAQLRA